MRHISARVMHESREAMPRVLRNDRDEYKGSILRITGENDEQGFPMNQGVLPYRVKFLLSDGCSCYRPRHTKIHYTTHQHQESPPCFSSRSPSFATFNNIVLFALYAVVLCMLLRAMFKPFFSSQGHPRSVVRRRIRLLARQACRAATVVQDRRGDPSHVLDQTRSSLRMLRPARMPTRCTNLARRPFIRRFRRA
ncbi:hypothetical protein FIBSPDRAFT_187287 [Athelia psychrophila]|uniref:Uncharacterized protein n=1 Tax=Athelia psychrophila TaxID=1759441 RepID=A0A166A7N6_9AGAM|nr:hypothetical protein FIBSPDRAFT_187287 [Fibularhizoctonia sp. CBS 109695]